jgi:uncharacterized protein (TIGR03000 family)
MFKKAFSFGVMLLLTGAVVLVTPGTGQAQHHGGGGGHGGGFSHGGSFSHGGGFNHGGSFNHGGFNHGSFNHAGFNHGFNHAGFNHGGFNHGFNHGGSLWGYPGYYGGYGAWPYYYGSYPYSSDPYSYGSLSPAYDSGYDDSYGELTTSYPNSYTPPLAQPDLSAHVTVSAPADAEIWFNDIKTAATGAVREFQSPPLTLGTRYAYEIRARWNENAHEMNQTQHVEVGAGTLVRVSFPVQPATDPTTTSR